MLYFMQDHNIKKNYPKYINFNHTKLIRLYSDLNVYKKKCLLCKTIILTEINGGCNLYK